MQPKPRAARLEPVARVPAGSPPLGGEALPPPQPHADMGTACAATDRDVDPSWQVI